MLDTRRCLSLKRGVRLSRFKTARAALDRRLDLLAKRSWELRGEMNGLCDEIDRRMQQGRRVKRLSAELDRLREDYWGNETRYQSLRARLPKKRRVRPHL